MGDFRTRCALAILGGLVGFGLSTAAHAETNKVTLRLDWKPGAQHAPFYYGKAKGYYAEEGIDLTIVPGSGSSDAVKQLGSRAVDVGLVDALVLVQAAEQRVPVKAIAAYYQRTPIVLMSPAAKPVTDPKQLLSGVKLGSKKGSATYQGLVALLGANKIQLEQIQLIDIGFGVQPLLVHQVDAMMGFSMNEPVEAEKAGMEIHEMPIADYGVHVYGLTISSNNDFMQKHGAALAAFMRATAKAVSGAASDKSATIDALAKSVDELDRAYESKVLDKTVPYWMDKQTKANGFGSQTDSGWQQTVDTAKSLGLVDTPPAAKDLFTTAYLQKK